MQNLYYTDLDTDAQRLQQPVCCISRGTQPRKSPVGQLVHLRWLQLDSIFTLLSSRDFDSSYPAQLIFYFAQKKGLNYYVRFELRRLFVFTMNTLLNFRFFKTFLRWKREFYIRFYGKIFEPPVIEGHSLNSSLPAHHLIVELTSSEPPGLSENVLSLVSTWIVGVAELDFM